MEKARIAIIGATGMVGEMITKVLEEREFPISEIFFFASDKSEGKEIVFRGVKYPIEVLNEEAFHRDLDIAFFAAGEPISLQYGRYAQKQGILVIDNSSTFRMESDVPLVLPEVNPEDLSLQRGLISNPNCVTIQSMLPLSVIHQHYGLKRIVYSTYQAVSGSGYRGVNDLKAGIEGIAPVYYPKPIAFNCIPQIDEFTDSGYTIEEMKMIRETKKILHDEAIRITATCVRIPVWNGHSIMINAETETDFELETVISMIKAKPGIKVFDYPDYPTARIASGQDLVYVGRIRRDHSVSHGLNLWVTADNIRKGAAANAVQIAQMVWKKKMEESI